MAGIKNVEGYVGYVVNICPKNSEGKIVEIAGFLFSFPLLRHMKRSYFTTDPVKCRCGRDSMCRKNCFVFALWMNGRKSQRSFAISTHRTLKGNFSADVTVFGSTITVILHT